MIRIVVAAGLVLGLLAAGLLALPALLTPHSIAREIEAAVEQSIGRKLEFAGKPRLDLWPEPVIEIRGATLFNPKGMSRGWLATAQALRLKVSAWPLVRGAVEVEEAVLIGPRLNLVIEADGLSNFGIEPASAEGEALEGLGTAPLVLQDAEVKYLDERTGKAFAVSNLDLRLRVPAPGEPFELRGEIPWNDHRLVIAAYVRSPARLSREGSPVDLTVTGPLLSASFSGRAALKQGLELAGKANARTPSLRDLAALAGLPLGRNGLGEFSVAGSLDFAGRRLSLEDARLKLDQTNAQGALTVDLGGPRPRITGKLGADRIDFNRYFETAKPTGSVWAAGWSGAPIELGALKQLDAELVLAASELIYGKAVVGRSRIEATLDDGVLVAGLTGTGFYGGTAEARIVLDATGKLPSLRGSLSAAGIDGRKLMADATGVDDIAGKTDIHFDLSASGGSQQELISLLRGKARVRLSDGVVQSVDVAEMLKAVGRGVLEGWSAASDHQTDFSLFEATFTVEDGIAETRDLKLIGPVARVTAEGSIDLLRQRLDLKARPFVTAADEDGGEELLTLPVPVVIEGDWAAPKIYPDIAGILDDPEAGYAALDKLMGRGKAIGLDPGGGKVDKAATDSKLEPAKASREPQPSQ